MQYFNWPSIGAYCVFTVFVFYQQLHARDFQGASQVFGLVLSVFGFAGMLTGFAYLVYYGWSVVWWSALVVFALGLLASIPGLLVERVIGKFTLSILGFIVWPISAYFMFSLLPSGT